MSQSDRPITPSTVFSFVKQWWPIAVVFWTTSAGIVGGVFTAEMKMAAFENRQNDAAARIQAMAEAILDMRRQQETTLQSRFENLPRLNAVILSTQQLDDHVHAIDGRLDQIRETQAQMHEMLATINERLNFINPQMKSDRHQ